mgnify:CR=1 FL=1
MKLESTLVGVAGEYLVAGELTLRGYIASITLRNSRGIDIIISSSDGSRSASIQVKTNSTGRSTWMLNRKAETFEAKNHYYIFVALKGLSIRPSFHIVPSSEVAHYVRTSHQEWLSKTKRDGSARKDSSMRNFADPSNQYLEAWRLIHF